MNTNSSLCIGCLSVERKMTTLNQEFAQIFVEFMEHYNFTREMSLCFECIALVRRFCEFKKQVQQAHTFLSFCLKQEEIPKSLSKLQLNNAYQIDTYHQEINQRNIIYLQTDNDKDHNKKIKNKIYQNSSKLFQDENCGLNVCVVDSNDSGNISNETEYPEPLAFVKMEDPTVTDDDHQAEQFKLNKSSYTDSDDEPLQMKSKKKNKKKKKEKQVDPRVARNLKVLNVSPGDVALVLLTWEQVLEERSRALQSAALSAHHCAACVLPFNHKHKLEQHNRKHSPEAGDEVCDVCSVRCKTKAALAAHRRRHRARWVCQVCGARFSRAGVAADHAARAHGRPRPTHGCPRCEHTAPSLGALRMHLKSHSARPECALCGESFTDTSSLRTHTFVHRGEKEHVCPTCGKRFMFKKQREIHELTHLSHQHLYCHKCDVTFKNQTSFYQHMKYSLKHIDPKDIKHECGVCGRRFVKAKRLEEHNLALHLKLTPIHCPLPDCAYTCASRAALRAHRRLTHVHTHVHTHAPRSLVCHRCGNTYKSKKSLEGHLRSHNISQRNSGK